MTQNNPQEAPNDNPELVLIGKVVGTFGLKGALKIWPDTDFPERFDPGETVYINEKPYSIIESAWHGKQARIWLKGVTKLESAQELVDKSVFASISETPPLEDGQYFVNDLIGMDVVTNDGKKLGTLNEIISAPAADIYRVGEILIPAVHEFILDIDVETRRMTVKVIPGMLPNEN